eukprot:932950-Karenia_brevis.AAC.1
MDVDREEVISGANTREAVDNLENFYATVPEGPARSYGPMGGPPRNALRRLPTTAADPPPALMNIAEEIDLDSDRPNILPIRRQDQSG